jgi:hypothetical protein
MPPLRTLMVAAALAASGLACAAPLDDPARFLDGGVESEGSCAIDVESDLLAVKCAGSVCHSAGDQKAAGLDLVSPGVAERVANVASESSACGGNMLVVPGDPSASLLYQKVASEPPCGSRMPLGQDPLSGDDIGCVASWIQEMAP